MDIQIYQVGGSVRDKILNRVCSDIDYCVIAPSYNHMIQALKDRDIKIVYEKEEYLTCTNEVSIFFLHQQFPGPQFLFCSLNQLKDALV